VCETYESLGIAVKMKLSLLLGPNLICYIYKERKRTEIFIFHTD